MNQNDTMGSVERTIEVSIVLTYASDCCFFRIMSIINSRLHFPKNIWLFCKMIILSISNKTYRSKIFRFLPKRNLHYIRRYNFRCCCYKSERTRTSLSYTRLRLKINIPDATKDLWNYEKRITHLLVCKSENIDFSYTVSLSICLGLLAVRA